MKARGESIRRVHIPVSLLKKRYPEGPLPSPLAGYFYLILSPNVNLDYHTGSRCVCCNIATLILPPSDAISRLSSGCSCTCYFLTRQTHPRVPCLATPVTPAAAAARLASLTHMKKLHLYWWSTSSRSLSWRPLSYPGPTGRAQR